MKPRRTPQKGDYVLVDNRAHIWKGRRGRVQRVGTDLHPNYALVEWAGSKEGEPMSWMWFDNILVTRRPAKHECPANPKVIRHKLRKQRRRK